MNANALGEWLDAKIGIPRWLVILATPILVLDALNGIVQTVVWLS